MHPLQNLFDDAGIEARSYSGRGMHSRGCLGVVLDRDTSLGDFIADVIEAIVDQEDESLDDITEAFRGMATDSMGLGTVVYFPEVPYDSGDGDSDEDEDEAEDLEQDDEEDDS